MKKRIFKVLSILFLLVLAMLIYYFFIHEKGFYIPCPFHFLTGFYCPGCGITRCLVSLFEGHLYSAFRMNPLVFIYLPFIGFYIGYQIYLYISNKRDKIICKIPNLIWIILIVLTLSYGVLRNIPFFSFLAPHVV